METTVLIGCPVCGRRYRYDTARFGTSGVRLRCRSCEAVMRVEIPVPLLGESAAPAFRTAVKEEAPSRERIPAAVPVDSRHEAEPPAAPAEPPAAGSLPVPPWETEEESAPGLSGASQPDFPAEPPEPVEAFRSPESSAGGEGLPAAEPPAAGSLPVPPWEREEGSAPGLSWASQPDLPAEPPEPAEASRSPEPETGENASEHGLRSALEREAERCLDEIFAGGEDVQETAALPVALVADRDEAMRALLAAVLRDSGFQVEEATDGIEARRMLAAHRPAVVFLNAFLPQILGVTLCAEIKGHPELASGTRVIIVGSLYRRDRFVRNPRDFYGADDFLDGSGSAEEIRRRAVELCADLRGEKPVAVESEVDERGELMRLARIVAGDIILYNPQTAEQEIAEGRFFDTFAQEIREGESLVAHRYPHVAGHQGLYHKTLREAVLQHGEAAGIPVHPGS